MNTYIIPCLAAFFACLGFALVYQIRGKNIIIAALCGTFAWAVYLVSYNFFHHSPFIAYFLSGVSIGLFSEVASAVFKEPVTLYLLPGIIPTVPGVAIYKAMENCLAGNLSAFGTYAIQTIKVGGAIALGIIIFSSLARLLKSGIERVLKTTP